jgi:hypothetical protein
MEDILILFNVNIGSDFNIIIHSLFTNTRSNMDGGKFIGV